MIDIAVIGAGPAGMMAAIQAAAFKKEVLLFERNAAPGRKILLTGKGRCNVTNAGEPGAFVEKFSSSGRFLKHAFYSFTSNDLTGFFESNGLALKVERQSRVFPADDQAGSIVKALQSRLKSSGVQIKIHSRLKKTDRRRGVFQLSFHKGPLLSADKIILCCGGDSYRATGSSGDGFRIAKTLGHTIQPLTPALVPLKTQEKWVKDLQGLTLKNCRITFTHQKKRLVSPVGDMMFTHFGVSGPLILDLSGNIVSLLKETKQITMFIDLKPGLSPEQIDRRLLRDIKGHGQKTFKNLLQDMLPKKIIQPFLNIARIDPDKKSCQITSSQRHQITTLLKALPATIKGALALEHAMVTNGGVSTKEINPKTMESRLVTGLYFAGEIIDGAAPSGGYNLQQAFATGYLAGKAAGI